MDFSIKYIKFFHGISSRLRNASSRWSLTSSVVFKLDRRPGNNDNSNEGPYSSKNGSVSGMSEANSSPLTIWLVR